MIDYSWVSAAMTTTVEKPVPAVSKSQDPCKPRKSWIGLSYEEKRLLEPYIAGSVKQIGVYKTQAKLSCEGLQLPKETLILAVSTVTLLKVAKKYGWKPRFRA